MSCRHVEPLLARHLEGCLSERQAATVVTHLADCPACRSFCAELAALRTELRDLPAPPSSPDLPHRAVDRWLTEAADRKVMPRTVLSWPRQVNAKKQLSPIAGGAGLARPG